MKAIAIALVLTFACFGTLLATESGGDITPPVLVGASVDRHQIDTTYASQTITFTLHITDDLSGVKGVHLGLRHIAGYNEGRECQNWPAEVKRDVVLECAITWPQYSAEGLWMVTWFVSTDGVGNSNDGNMATCTDFDNGKCHHLEYTDAASPIVRSMEITIGPSAPPSNHLYLAMLAH
jgi:hypothetical protein